ncbi:MAG: HD domain-containing protein [Candidatus Gastranaerophilales bacterium]|nr:HD domain-containing protein [Candidatus Gastranaerophilales bacterium]
MLLQVGFQNHDKKTHFLPTQNSLSKPRGQGSLLTSSKIHPLRSDQVQIAFTGIKTPPAKAIFASVAMTPQNPKWKQAIKRELPVRKKANDPRTDFERDFNRILHSEGYDRLRYKAQTYVKAHKGVLPDAKIAHVAPPNDMVSTRSTHVSQVADIAKRICKKLGLNEELAEAIAHGHDIGHSPFGHEGEHILRRISSDEGLEPFWHEKNSLNMVDNLVTLKNKKGLSKNLNLTYAVRDGIITHCGEVDQNGIKPRNEVIDLMSLKKASETQPFTWEGCIVKISDKIAYIGRDIEDAQRLGILNEGNQKDLQKIIKKHIPKFKNEVNNSSLIDLFIDDIVKNSSIDNGIGFSKPVFEAMKEIKNYNYKNIYHTEALHPPAEYFNTVLRTTFNTYDNLYKGENTLQELDRHANLPTKDFKDWLIKHTDSEQKPKEYKNKIVYDLKDQQQYKKAIIDYMSGMTDDFAVTTYKKISQAEKINKLSELKNQITSSAIYGDYKTYKATKRTYAKQAIEDFDAAKQAPAMTIQNIPVFSKLGWKILKIAIREHFSSKTPEEKLLKQKAKLLKMEELYKKTHPET